jgi:glycosyltransferase involved in cell wall biosynthesis
MGAFERDPYEGRPKILFVGLSESSHTHAWIDLLDGAPLNVRLFALPTGLPPAAWNVRTYVTAATGEKMPSKTRAGLPVKMLGGRIVSFAAAKLGLRSARPDLRAKWLSEVIREWRPDIIHTLGLDSAFFYFKVRRQFALHEIGRWVVQVRGGPELALHRLMAEHRPRIEQILAECDQLIADNKQNYEYATALRLSADRVSPLGVVPGTGGIDIDSLQAIAKGPPSRRERIILWPKAYECPAGKALPVFEALKLAWPRIAPCKIYMTAATPETQMWFHTLPRPIQDASQIVERLPRPELLNVLSRSRVMLAPSLADGIPNCLYEAMAAGAFPILSPLETICSVVSEGTNVLFARNLYPQEIADALCRAMTEDSLIDAAASRNLTLVRKLADRSHIRSRVIRYYEQLTARHQHEDASAVLTAGSGST